MKSHHYGHTARSLSIAQAFTLIEVLVVVAIIALLVAVLLPSLKKARDAAKASMCAHNIKQLTNSGTMWLMQTKDDGEVPANRGWAPHVMKVMSGETEPFTCPSDEQPHPIPAIIVSQIGRAGTGSGRTRDITYPSVSVDGGYFRRHPEPTANVYQADMETDVTRAANDSANDFDDCTIRYEPDNGDGPLGDVWAQKTHTGRELTLRDWRGRTLAEDFSSTDRFHLPILWGSYAMNVSASIKGTKPWHLVYLDYHDWAAVVESALEIRDMNNNFRVDDPEKMAAFRHNGRVNGGFMDGHVERLVPSRLELPRDESESSIWHPERPQGWRPVMD